MIKDLELDKAIKHIKEVEAKTVLIQMPEGLKPKGLEIATTLEKETGAEVFIWAGACYGSCDVPPDIKAVDLLIQFGHSIWPFWKDHDSVKVTAQYNLEEA